MKRVQILAVTVFVLALAFYYTVNWVYGDKPADIRYLDKQIAQLNESLITAQILSNELDRVYNLFEENLAESKSDEVTEDASMDFLNSLTMTLDSLGITTIYMRPKPRITGRISVETPYDLEIRCNYKQFGVLMAKLESSMRLIQVNEFHVKNGIERLKNTKDERILSEQNIELKISTLTLLKGKK
ncbi:MAG: type 4a pilus biogenesis protein PilO [Candidatus Marinimicrobia bacterium]|jgi:Tfp pilus assembly protein PilO|nr:type 4a pilus biogenesis protein PilO [Candidatus Neomarinimicrobiota bacterium]MBT4361270.1 type 4a pilus biogenesis protein PilO [Candidatus Neomarinimicrobiota bacterium]MBT4714047.1 type 4a pilus biogenesis protein PilO [Candidatus Neomarinimicrobiota bacterium]MBT4948029.1 type 4a pilus biogenesis protein PilO [Candidatus Neomarinimicrobiota bacterium]MBT5269305.1 type 4a pilus biogenesis protein PilO [Candidatus Neomarinimicrobiota bacterium]